MGWHFATPLRNVCHSSADNFSIIADYSYLSNESREPVSISDDTYGEHRLFLGMEVRFASQRH